MELHHNIVKTNGLISSLTLLAVWATVITSIVISINANLLPVYLLSILIIGICQRYLEELSHQATHRNLFSHLKLNDKLDYFYSIPLFYTIKGDRAEHYLHHSHLKEHQIKKNYFYDHLGISNKLVEKKWYRLFILFVQPLLGIQGLIECKNILTNTKKYFFRCYAYHILIILMLAYFHLAYIYLYYWLIPYFLVFSCLYYYSELFTHFGCRNKFLSRDTSNWVVNFFIAPLGFCKYHSLHHLAPKIPFYKYSHVEDNYEKNRQSLFYTFHDMINPK